MKTRREITTIKEITTIQISNQTWEKLNGLKKRGESFDEVINKLFEHSTFKQSPKISYKGDKMFCNGYAVAESKPRAKLNIAELGRICLMLIEKEKIDKKELSKRLNISMKKIDFAIDIFNKEKAEKQK